MNATYFHLQKIESTPDVEESQFCSIDRVAVRPSPFPLAIEKGERYYSPATPVSYPVRAESMAVWRGEREKKEGRETRDRGARRTTKKEPRDQLPMISQPKAGTRLI